MFISTIKRQVKNVAYNYSIAQLKVRDATSNDPWGPTTTLMTEIADLTHDPVAFTEIMVILWKRLNDHGKNWRHVYKSLGLMEYLIKGGNEKVSQQCRENIYIIETLKDFQFFEANRDQGMNVRERAKQMVALLNDEEQLKNVRSRYQLTRKRCVKSGISMKDEEHRKNEVEEARSSNMGEDDMELQIALAISREEHAKEEEKRRSDDVRLQIALEESTKTINAGNDAFANNGFIPSVYSSLNQSNGKPTSTLESALEDLMMLNFYDPMPSYNYAP